MGTEARIVLYAARRDSAEAASRAAFARIAELDSILSDYRLDSELERVSAATDSAVPLSNDLFTVLRLGQAVARETNGAFDMTVGPLVRLWREARANQRLPSVSAICAAMQRTGWRLLTVDSVQRTARFSRAGMQLDAGGIAKGHAADAALAVLRARGVDRALVALGGDIVVGRAPPDASGWTVAVGADAPDSTVTIEHGAISTSGDAEQFVDIDGVRYSHIIDPRTGLGLVGGVTVTVRAATGIEADAWATAASVLDSTARAAFIVARPAARFYGRGVSSAASRSRTNVSSTCTRSGVSTNVARTLTRTPGA